MAELLVFPQDLVLQAIDPADAIERVQGRVRRVRGQRVADAAEGVSRRLAERGLSRDAGQGAGLAILKWVTSFPATRRRAARS
jgi:hypothetical protein